MTILYLVATLPLLLYLNHLWIVYIPYQKTFYISRFQNLCSIIRQQTHPEYVVLEKTIDKEYTTITRQYTLHNCDTFDYGQFSLRYRPLVGDHIHLGYILSLNGRRLTLHDRNVTENVAYENKSSLCSAQGNVAYTQTWLHSGIHTHCDNIIHIHPWSAYLPRTGRDVVLKEWFKSVRIEDFNHHNLGYKIDGHFYHLKMDYYKHVTDAKPSFTTDNFKDINGLWLKDHHALVVLYTGKYEITGEDRQRVLSKSKYPINYP